MDHDLGVVLKPLSRPELGDIRIADGVFAVGRNEQPFAHHGPDVLAMLSRRHARIFRENGVVYLADLGSRNGTTINRVAIEQTPQPLHDGDEIGFGGVLSYRVQIAPRALKARPTAGLTLTLTPESAHSGLDTLVITRFPFLVSKADPMFARYQAAQARQVSYLSRRQAHVFQKGGGVCIEDLASTNGTFVDGLRLQEHAVPLHDGVLVAFGGDHFTYRVGITNQAQTEPVPAGPAPRRHRHPRRHPRRRPRPPTRRPSPASQPHGSPLRPTRPRSSSPPPRSSTSSASTRRPATPSLPVAPSPCLPHPPPGPRQRWQTRRTRRSAGRAGGCCCCCPNSRR